MVETGKDFVGAEAPLLTGVDVQGVDAQTRVIVSNRPSLSMSATSGSYQRLSPDLA